ncbi:hypothetical protein NDU88_006841 [Pleurodeles waltl]|uniref:Uncharacterized protein n=1 Tax=Pleurodeles waltl TaxID=8319 RepID=A0AAV7MH65_PLEWA|nr:hypothetical protein NDU88_006841 [Pleurodeles waltl]
MNREGAPKKELEDVQEAQKVDLAQEPHPYQMPMSNGGSLLGSCVIRLWGNQYRSMKQSRLAQWRRENRRDNKIRRRRRRSITLHDDSEPLNERDTAIQLEMDNSTRSHDDSQPLNERDTAIQLERDHSITLHEDSEPLNEQDTDIQLERDHSITSHDDSEPLNEQDTAIQPERDHRMTPNPSMNKTLPSNNRKTTDSHHMMT